MTLSLIGGMAQCCFSLRMYAWVVSAVCRVLTFILILSLGSYAAFIMGPLLAAVENLSKDLTDATTLRDFAISSTSNGGGGGGGGAVWSIERGDIVALDWQGGATNAMHLELTAAQQDGSSLGLTVAASLSLATACNKSNVLRAVPGGWLATCLPSGASSSCSIVTVSSFTGELSLLEAAPASVTDSLCSDSVSWASVLDLPSSSAHVTTVFAPLITDRCAAVLNMTLLADGSHIHQQLALTLTTIPSLPARSVSIALLRGNMPSNTTLALAVDVGASMIALLTLDLTTLNATYVTGVAVGSSVRLQGIGASASSDSSRSVNLLLWEPFAVGTATVGASLLPQLAFYSIRLADGIVSDPLLLPHLNNQGEPWVLLNTSTIYGLMDASCVVLSPAGQLIVSAQCNTQLGSSAYNVMWVGGIRFIGVASSGSLPDGTVSVVIAGAATVSASYGALTPGTSYVVGPGSRSLVSLTAASFQLLGYGVRRTGIAVGPHTLLLSQ